MERIYNVTLNFNPNRPYTQETQFKEYNLFVTEFKNYLLSLGLFNPDTKETFVGGSHLFTRTHDGGHIDIIHPGSGSMLHSIAIQSIRYLEELEAIKYALTIAKQLESATPPFNPKLTFNPDFIYLFVGRDSEGNHIQVEDFMPNAKELQRKLYGGGNIAYGESGGAFGMFLGVKKEFSKHYYNEIIKVKGKARPASSLDDLLTRIE